MSFGSGPNFLDHQALRTTKIRSRPMLISYDHIWKNMENNIDKLVFRISNFECPTMPQLSLGHFSLLLRLLFLLTKRPFPG